MEHTFAEDYADERLRAAGIIADKFPLPPVMLPDSTDDEWEVRDGMAHCTPRTAFMLHHFLTNAGETLVDTMWESDDVPSSGATDTRFESGLVPVTAGARTREWMCRFAAAYLDLADDLVRRGCDPRPLCTAEEIALWTAIDHMDDNGVENALDDSEELFAALDTLPEHPDDYDIAALQEVLFEDTDFLWAFNYSLVHTGRAPEDAADRAAESLERVRNWFEWFRPEETRPPRLLSRYDIPSLERFDFDEDGLPGSTCGEELILVKNAVREYMDLLWESDPGKAEQHAEVLAEVFATALSFGGSREERIAAYRSEFSDVLGDVEQFDMDGVQLYRLTGEHDDDDDEEARDLRGTMLMAWHPRRPAE